MTNGRPNKGLGHVDGLDADATQKERLRVILATISGELSVQDACAELGIGRARFSELRRLALQGACDSLRPGSPGRPRTRDVERDEELDALRAECKQLESEASAAQLKAELALSMPRILAEYEKRGAAAKQSDSEG